MQTSLSPGRRTKSGLFGLMLVGTAASMMLGCTQMCGDKKSKSSGGEITTKAIQASLTPDQAVERLLEGNERFVAGKPAKKDLRLQVTETSTGQYPYAIVLGCIDSRTPPELVFDTNLGDIFAPRIAGNYANTDILGSMEFAAAVAGAKAIVVVGHSECGAVKGAVDAVRLGNLTTVVQAIEPATADVKAKGERTSKNHDYVQATAEANVRRTVASIRQNSDLLRKLEADGKLKIVGAMQDLSTGKVTVIQ